jgi:hypothetical protein
MARFKEDSYYPEPMWGVKQRDAYLQLPDEKSFYTKLIKVIQDKL